MKDEEVEEIEEDGAAGAAETRDKGRSARILEVY